jgi:hypothetical protein
VTAPDLDGNGAAEQPPPKKRRLAALWMTAAEVAWDIKKVGHCRMKEEGGVGWWWWG